MNRPKGSTMATIRVEIYHRLTESPAKHWLHCDACGNDGSLCDNAVTYQLKYTYPRQGDIADPYFLETVWRENNVVDGTDDEYPVIHQTRSLMVGDVAVAEYTVTKERQAFRVDPIGWSGMSTAKGMRFEG